MSRRARPLDERRLRRAGATRAEVATIVGEYQRSDISVQDQLRRFINTHAIGDLSEWVNARRHVADEPVAVRNDVVASSNPLLGGTPVEPVEHDADGDDVPHETESGDEDDEAAGEPSGE